MGIAAQMNTLRAYCGTTQEACRTLEQVKNLGFDGVEWNFTLLRELDRPQIARVQKELGLQTSTLLSPFARCGFGMEDMIAEARLFDCTHVGIGCITGSFFIPGPAGVASYLQHAKAACEALRAQGLTPVYDLQHHEFLRQKDGTWIFTALEELDLQWEAGLLSMVQTGMDPREILARLDGKLWACRLSDQKIRDNQTYFFFTNREECPLGEGILPVSVCAEHALARGAQWLVVGQDLCDRDPFQCLQVSLEYTRKLLQKMGPIAK